MGVRVLCPPGTTKAGQRIEWPQGLAVTDHTKTQECGGGVASRNPFRVGGALQPPRPRNRRTIGVAPGGRRRPMPASSLPGDFSGGGGIGETIGGAIGGIFGETGEEIGGAIGGFVGSTFGGGGTTTTGRAFRPRGCPPGYEKRNGECLETGVRGTIRRTLPGGRSGTLEDVMGEPVNGRYGVGVVPSERVTSVLDCPSGMVLGKDNICYERLRKSERKWPPGRKPLLTGGEMNAITIAKRAAEKLHRTKKRLRKTKNALKKVT